jgi:hypothetical protein
MYIFTSKKVVCKKVNSILIDLIKKIKKTIFHCMTFHYININIQMFITYICFYRKYILECINSFMLSRYQQYLLAFVYLLWTLFEELIVTICQFNFEVYILLLIS